MSEELNERSRRILEAIVEDYITSAEPIGSRTVTRRHQLALSPATVRNVMADLEEMGFLVSPHTSAGRIPTEKGYRFYVDSILQVGPIQEAERQRLESLSGLQGVRIEDRLRKAGKILSSISNYTGIVMAPRFDSTVFRHIEFIRLSRGKLLVVFVSHSGLVQNKIVETDKDLPQRDLERINNYLNQSLKDLSIQEVKKRIVGEMAHEKALYDRLLCDAMELSREALKGELEEEVFIEGTMNILNQPEFADVEQMRRLFRTFEQKGMLVELLDKTQQAEGVQIFIGSSSGLRDLEGCSLITSTYSNRRGTLGTLGVIGPSRMRYSMVIPIVDYTAQLLGQVLDSEVE